MNALLPLIDKFLEDAGDKGRPVFEAACATNFDAEGMITECGKIAKEHGFWDAHLLEALKACGISWDEWQSFCAEDTDDMGSEVYEQCRAIKSLVDCEVIGDPIIFLALILTEGAESIEAVRRRNRTGKDGLWEELADVIIRLFDFTARYGPKDHVTPRAFMELVAAKMAKNETRPFLHGKTC